MPNFRPLITDFSAGELAPSMWGRVDREVQAKGASLMLNYMPRKQGGFRVRPGTLWVGHTAGPDAAAQLFSIKIGANVSYVLEFTNNLIRFWKYTNGTMTYVSGQDKVTTYLTAELSALQVGWLYPDFFIAHRAHPPARVRYGGSDTFTYANINFVTTSYTFTANTVNGSPTLTNLSSTNLPVASASGLWLLTGTGIPASTYLTAVYPSATPSLNIAALSATMNNNATATNTGVSLTLTEQPVPFQSAGNYPKCVGVAFSRVWWANTNASPQTLWASIVGVWDSGDPGGSSGNMNMNLFEGIIYNQQQMIVDASGNPTANPPQYQNLQLTNNSVSDSDAIQITLSETESEILWIAPGRDLIIGSADGETVIPGSSTANNVSAQVVGRTGSTAIQASQMNEGVVFVQLAGKNVFLLNWQGAFILMPPPRDLTFFSYHLFSNNPITAFEFVQAPDTILYFLRTDGSLAACLFDPSYQTQAWWQLDPANSGIITSIATISASDRDILVMSVTRGSYNYIELLTTPDWTDARTAIYLDAATYTYNATPFTTVTVDSSFNGATLTVIADGRKIGTAIPSGGTLTLPGSISANYCSVGYAYAPEVDTLPINTPGQTGTGLLSLRMVEHVRVMYYKTLDLSFAYKRLDGTTSSPASVENFSGYNVNVANPTPQTGVDRVPIDASAEMETILVITSPNSMPCEVTALVPEVSLED